MRKRELQIHIILTGGRKYQFLFIEDQLNTHDGRRVLLLRTLSGVQRVEIMKGEKVLYLGSRSVNPTKDVESAPESEEVTAECSLGED